MQQEISNVVITRKDKSKFRIDIEGIDEYTGMKRYFLTTNMDKEPAQRRRYIIFSDGPGIDFNTVLNDQEYLEVLANSLLSAKRLDSKIALAEELTGQRKCIFVGHVNRDERTNRYDKFHVEEDRVSLARINQSIKKGLKKKDVSVENIDTYLENIAKCRDAIIGGCGFAKVEGDISLGKDMYASSSIGNVRDNQEDAVLLIHHPQNSEFKMMVVADGMGGHADGEKASAEVVNTLKQWFERLDVRLYSDSGSIEYEIAGALIKLNREVCSKYGENAGSTVVASIIGENDATIANVGDSRAYITKNGTLRQITRDDSLVYDLYERGVIAQKDDARFHREANKISKYIGHEGDISPEVLTLNKKDFDSIILCSDGLTDCLSDEQIMAITKSTDRKVLSKRLVEAALNNTSRKREGLDDSYREVITAGKDNATVAIYDNSDEGR